MNTNTRDAVIAACVTAVVIAAMVISGELAVLWLLALLLFLAY